MKLTTYLISGITLTSHIFFSSLSFAMEDPNPPKDPNSLYRPVELEHSYEDPFMEGDSAEDENEINVIKYVKNYLPHFLVYEDGALKVIPDKKNFADSSSDVEIASYYYNKEEKSSYWAAYENLSPDQKKVLNEHGHLLLSKCFGNLNTKILEILKSLTPDMISSLGNCQNLFESVGAGARIDLFNFCNGLTYLGVENLLAQGKFRVFLTVSGKLTREQIDAFCKYPAVLGNIIYTADRDELLNFAKKLTPEQIIALGESSEQFIDRLGFHNTIRLLRFCDGLDNPKLIRNVLSKCKHKSDWKAQI